MTASPHDFVGPDESNRAHDYSDVDVGPDSQHHTLGDGPTQSASGTHNHSKAWLAEKTGTLLISGNPGVDKWLPSGFYNINGSASMPTMGWYLILHMRHSNPANNYARQLAFAFAPNSTNYTRAIENNSPTAWAPVGF